MSLLFWILQIVSVTRTANVEFCKNFWSITESDIMQVKLIKWAMTTYVKHWGREACCLAWLQGLVISLSGCAFLGVSSHQGEWSHVSDARAFWTSSCQHWQPNRFDYNHTSLCPHRARDNQSQTHVIRAQGGAGNTFINGMLKYGFNV